MYPGECSLYIWDEDNFSAVRWCYIYLVYSVVQILFPYWSCLISLSTVENTVLNSLNIMFCYKFLPLLLFSCSVISDSLQSHGLQCAKLPCPSLTSLTLLLEFAQTHVHWVDDAIQSYHPLSPPSPPALNLSQHQSLFQWVGSSHEVLHVFGVLWCSGHIYLVIDIFS